MTSPDSVIATTDVDQLYALARRLGFEAASLIEEGRSHAIQNVDTKSDPTDVVTAMDRACEQLLRERLAELRPDDGIHGEEHDEQDGTSGVRWIIDPIDGTVNYLYGLAGYAVSIGVEVDGTLEIGVVTQPTTGEQFHACRGRGAYCDERRLTASTPDSLGVALVATGFGYLPERRAAQGAVAAALLPQVRDLRRLGSASLDLCNVAAGRVDGYYEWGTHIWDWAAGVVICREAGVDVRLPIHDEGLVVAAAPTIADELNAAVRARVEPDWNVPA